MLTTISAKDSHDLGYQLGKLWATYLDNNSLFLDGRMRFYRDLAELKQANRRASLWSGVKPHRKYLREKFPMIDAEITGMAEGAKDCGYKGAVPEAIYKWCLGETEDVYDSRVACSSFVKPADDGHYLAHNEESDPADTAAPERPLPLIAVNVSMNGRVFFAVTYPFQLLGSSCGCNSRFAFQGNSIDPSQVCESLRIDDRIAKTVFTRRLLDLDTLDEYVELLRSFRTTLPNHQYMVFAKKAYSISICPSEKDNIVSVRPLDSFDANTNFFPPDIIIGRKFNFIGANDKQFRSGDADPNATEVILEDWGQKVRHKILTGSFGRAGNGKIWSFVDLHEHLPAKQKKLFMPSPLTMVFKVNKRGVAFRGKLHFANEQFSGEICR